MQLVVGIFILCFSRIKGVVSHVTRYFEIRSSRFYTLHHLTIICPLIMSQSAIFRNWTKKLKLI